MDLKTFFEHFDTLAEAPNGIQRLRELILDLAVRGKLVPQDPEDESTLNLLINIQKEKHDKGLKKKLSFEPISKEDIFYSAPDSWQWVRLGEVILGIEAGNSLQCEKRSKTEREWGIIKISAISWDKFNPDENKALPSGMTPKKEFEICAGDFLMSRANTKSLVGKSVVVESTPPRLLINDKTLRVIFPACLEKRFFNIYNNSSYARLYFAGEGTGTSDSMKNITRSQICNLPVPLPPLAEQKRIVAKVDELMALCDALEVAQQTRNTLRQNLRASALDALMNAAGDPELETAWAFVRDNWGVICDRAEDVEGLRQAIIQMAVRGKLLPQEATDTSVEELLKKIESCAEGLTTKRNKKSYRLKSSQETDIEFEIPKSWEWVEIGRLAESFTNGLYKPSGFYSDQGVASIRMYNIQDGYLDLTKIKRVLVDENELKTYALEKGDLVVNRVNSRELVGKAALVSDIREPFVFEAMNIRVRFLYKETIPEYVNLFFRTGRVRSFFQEIAKQASGQASISQPQVANILIPLPPLAEQNRIIAKVDELMKLCDQLEDSLRQQQQRAEALAASAISYLAA